MSTDIYDIRVAVTFITAINLELSKLDGKQGNSNQEVACTGQQRER